MAPLVHRYHYTAGTSAHPSQPTCCWPVQVRAWIGWTKTAFLGSFILSRKHDFMAKTGKGRTKGLRKSLQFSCGHTVCLSLSLPWTPNQSRSYCPPLNIYKAKEKGCAIVELRRLFVVKCNRMGNFFFLFFSRRKRTTVWRIYASCNLSLLFYALRPKWWWISFCAEESLEGWTGAGGVCAVWELIWYWIDKKEGGKGDFNLHSNTGCEN